MRIGKIGVAVISLVPFNVYAVPCTPAPDCDAIGYTETSCETISLKCPFDTSKLFCIPCDSSFKYDCTGDNITGGTGSACGGKYAGCECASGYSFNNGECECPASITATDCVVGAIYYPDGKCSNDYVACLNPVGVVIKDNALVMSWRKSSEMKWGGDGTDIADLTNFSSSSTAETDYAGAENNSIIVASHTSLGETASTSAAIYCNEYTPTGMESSKGQWYLPAAGELYDYMYGNYDKLLSIYTTHLGYSSFSYWFWSSSEYTSSNAWFVNSTNGNMYTNNKHNYSSVSCFLDIS